MTISVIIPTHKKGGAGRTPYSLFAGSGFSERKASNPFDFQLKRSGSEREIPAMGQGVL